MSGLDLSIALERYDRHVPFFMGAVEPPEGLTLRPLEVGMCFTIEPGLYIPADDESAPEALRGVGIRIEDDVLITPDGHDNLTASIPKRVEEVEALVGAGKP